ncbi:MAG: cyclic nucleotide-binding domain-containing protein [Desulfovibrionaceae bacterium]|jgi:CRP-like cAMP-binding protein|nr:cyclic nucleotide-binding domain-containing protein [Desulfovibrionaceae bacterium]
MLDDKWVSIELFKDMDASGLERVKALFSVTHRRPGEKLITEGDQGDEMFILVRGRVRISKSMIIKGMKLPLAELENPRKVLATLEGNACPIFGEMALLDRDIRSATVEVLEPSEFLVTDRERFFDFVGREPALGAHLLGALGRRLAATVRKNNSELVKLTTALALALSQR